MNLKLTTSFLFLAASILLLAACGDSQTADTPTPEAEVVATALKALERSLRKIESNIDEDGLEAHQHPGRRM